MDRSLTPTGRAATQTHPPGPCIRRRSVAKVPLGNVTPEESRAMRVPRLAPEAVLLLAALSPARGADSYETFREALDRSDGARTPFFRIDPDGRTLAVAAPATVADGLVHSLTWKRTTWRFAFADGMVASVSEAKGQAAP